MNRKLSRSSSGRDECYLRFLKPGALAQLRDSRINARSTRLLSILQINLRRTPSPPSSPEQPTEAGQTQAVTFEGFPCFVGRIYGPRCPQRKKLLASKSVFFLNPVPSTPVTDSPDPSSDLFSTDFLLSH